MGKIEKYGPLLALLSLLAAAAIGFRSLVMPYIVEPIAALLWAVWRIVISVDQTIYWGLLILVCLILTIRVFASGESSPPEAEPTHRHEPRTRVERWQSLLEEASFGDEEEAALRKGLIDLLASMVGQRETYSPSDLQAVLAAKRIVLPPAAQRYLLNSDADGRWPGRMRPLHTLRLVPGWLRRWIDDRTKRDRAEIHDLIRWMESYMEISHDQ